MHRYFTPWLLLFIIVFPSSLRGQRPRLLASDRPGVACPTFTLEPGQFQVEGGIGIDLIANAGSTDYSLGTPVVLRIGLLQDFEFRIFTSGYSLSSTRSGTLDGIGSQALGFKYRVKESAIGPSLAFLFNLELPVGSADFRPPEAVPSLVFSLDQGLSESWTMNVNFGSFIPSDENGERYNEVLYAASFWKSLTDRTTLFLEFAGNSPQLTGLDTQTLVDGGFTWSWKPDIQLDVSLVRGISGDSADWSVIGGIALRLN